MTIRDNNRKARLPSTAAKIGQIKGLSPDEKSLFVRIGNLIDSTVLTQRGLNNSGQVIGRKVSNKVPIPQGVIGTTVIGGVEVNWEPVNFNKFSKYELLFDTSPTFITATSIELINSRTLIKERFSGSVYIKVRTIDFTGNCSEFSGTTTVSVDNTAYDSDQDYIEPENRTTVQPKPTLLSKGLTVGGGERVFVGVGMAIGPGPLTFFDEANTGGQSELRGKIRNQITYSLLDFYMGLEDRTAGIPDYEVEQERFYTYSPFFYLQTQVFTGSMVDFFQTTALLNNPAYVDIEFLRYLTIPHVETGIVLNASDSTIKH